MQIVKSATLLGRLGFGAIALVPITGWGQQTYRLPTNDSDYNGMVFDSAQYVEQGSDPTGFVVTGKDARGFGQAVVSPPSGSGLNPFRVIGQGGYPYFSFEAYGASNNQILGQMSVTGGYQAVSFPVLGGAPTILAPGYQATGISQLLPDNTGSIFFVQSGVFKPGFLNANGTITPVTTDGVGSFAGPSLPGAVFHNSLFSLGGGGYAYRPEVHKSSDLSVIPWDLSVPGFGSVRANKVAGNFLIGGAGHVGSGLEFVNDQATVWDLPDEVLFNPQNVKLNVNGATGTAAYDVSTSGDVVGEGYGVGAVVWRRQTDGSYAPNNLNLLPGLDPKWNLLKATSIGTDGSILGIGKYDGVQAVFKITPVPEPTTMLALGAGMLALLRKRRRS